MITPRVLRQPFASLRDRLRRATPRERLLLASLAFMGTLFLVTGGARLLRSELSRRAAIAVRLSQAEALRQQAPILESALQDKRAGLTVGNLTPAEFLAKIDSHARECSLNAEAATPRTDKVKGISLHHARVTLRGASLARLMEFDDRIRLRTPGVAIERVTLEARSGDDLVATYELVAVQPE